MKVQSCKRNEQLFNNLMANFIRFNLLSPDRLQFLFPLFHEIKKTWNQGFLSPDPLIEEISHQDSEADQWASMTIWRNTQNGYYGQAIVSSPKNPLGLFEVMLYQLGKVVGRNFQLWFEPTVKLNSNFFGPRMMAKITQELGPDLCDSQQFHYFLLNLAEMSFSSNEFCIEELTQNNNSVFCEWIYRVRGKVYLETEELAGEDWKLQQTNTLYQKVGLHRSRVIPHKIMFRSSFVGGKASEQLFDFNQGENNEISK